ncbi:hypothetical protein KY284_023788 [Solanum tuberosum]|nr:hypothetical protein KY284_023788 [Solanum tuberosum]
MGEHKRLTKVLKFDSQIQSAAAGLSGGIVIMWKKNLLKLSDISMTSQSIHVMVQVFPETEPWFLSAIYVSNDPATRTNLWTELTNISRSMKGDWVIRGDFSEILKASEKLGGRGINLSRKILARVNGIQKSAAYLYNHFLWNLEAELLKEYEEILKVEEDFWKTKSWID